MEKKQIYAIVAVVVVVIAAIGAAVVLMNNGGGSKKIETIDDLNGATIGTIKGYTGDTFVLGDIENGNLSKDTKVLSYTTGAQAIESLKSGHVDCVIIDEQPAKKFIELNSGLKILDSNYVEESYALAVKKGNTALLDKINDAIAKLREDGTLKAIEDYYYEGKGTAYVKKDVDRSAGTLKMLTNAYFPPYESFKDGGDTGTIVGFDVDLMQAICDILGMELKCESIEFVTLITTLDGSKESENYVIAAGMTVTDERAKQVDFSNPYTKSIQVVITKA